MTSRCSCSVSEPSEGLCAPSALLFVCAPALLLRAFAMSSCLDALDLLREPLGPPAPVFLRRLERDAVEVFRGESLRAHDERDGHVTF